MNATVGLGHGDALDTMCAALVFHAAVGTLAFHDKSDIFDAALFSLVGIHDLDFPAATIGVAAIHAEKLCCEKGCLVATGTALNGHDSILLIHNVSWQQCD